MIEVYNKIYVGNEQDAKKLLFNSDWVVLHCCKNPFHCDMVGYRGNLNKNHPNYPYIVKGNRMALNLVDIEYYDSSWHEFYINMFANAFDFIDNQLSAGKRILIHCNKGESRGPSVALLYMGYQGYYQEFDKAVEDFRKKYPLYNPKSGIYENIKACWDYFTQTWKCE